MRKVTTFALGLAFAMLFAATNSARAVPVTSGLTAHFDAQTAGSVLNASSLPAANGQSVQTWVDLAASADASPFNSSARPTYDATGGPLGMPVIAFDGTENLISGSVGAQTVVLFHRWDAVGSPTYLMDFRSGIASGYVYTGAVGPDWSTFYINDSVTPSGGGVAAIRTGAWQMTTFVGPGAGTGAMHMMSRFSDTEFAPGAIGEILIYDDILTESERLATYAYIDARWNNLPPPAPEPSSFLLLGLGALGLNRRVRRRRSETA